MQTCRHGKTSWNQKLKLTLYIRTYGGVCWGTSTVLPLVRSCRIKHIPIFSLSTHPIKRQTNWWINPSAFVAIPYTAGLNCCLTNTVQWLWILTNTPNLLLTLVDTSGKATEKRLPCLLTNAILSKCLFSDSRGNIKVSNSYIFYS